MAQTLKAFFMQNAEQVPNKKVVISNRFKDENGNPVEWEIKALDAGTQQDIRTKAMEMKATGGKSSADIKMTYNTALSNILTAVNAVVFPNLNDKELQDSYGVKKPEELIGKMLLPDEFDKLIDKIDAIKITPEDLEEEAKN